MKNKITLILLLVFAISCTTGNKKNSFTITGTISHFDKPELLINLPDNSRDTITMDSTGFFEYELSLDFISSTYIMQNRNYIPIIMIPGEDVSITADFEDLKNSLSFGGSTADVQNYQTLTTEKSRANRINYKDLYSSEPANFVKYADSVYSAGISILEDYQAEHPELNEDFIEYEKFMLKLNRINTLYRYPTSYGYYNKEKELELPENYYDFLETLDHNMADKTENSSYFQFLNSYLSQKAGEIDADDPVAALENKLSQIPVCFESEIIRNKMYHNLMMNHIKGNGIDGIEKSKLDEILSYCTDTAYSNEINQEYKKWAKLAKGFASPDFTYLDIEGNEVSLSDFRGKYVYIDVWATWCGPCRGEIPHLEALEKEFHGKNIVFMSISCDRDKAAWEKMVKEDNMQGVQLHSDINQKPSVLDLFIVPYIPRFILIDRDGKFINSKAPRPSENIKEILLALEGIN